jgi:hypothetical protein
MFKKKLRVTTAQFVIFYLLVVYLEAQRLKCKISRPVILY